jgi:hypothetical protein
MHKIYLLLLFVSLYYSSYGQKLTFGPSLSAFLEDEAVQEIAEVWMQYILSFQSNHPDSVRTDLWLNNSEDMIKYSGYYNKTLRYQTGEQYTFNIRKLNDDIYEINTLSSPFKTRNGDIFIDNIYKVCATKLDGQFKLLNYFDVKKHLLNHYTSACIDYYYPPGLNFKQEEAEEAERFVRDFKQQYGIADNNLITYVVAHSIDAGNALLGIFYTMLRSEKTYAGLTIYPRTILSARPNHIHELVHAVMLPLHPAAPDILHEGIATYYGGGANKSYAEHKANVKQYLAENTVDFSEERNTYKEVGGGTQLSNTLGALIIEYVLKNYGTTRVLALFSSKDYEGIFSQIGISKDGINDFVIQKLIQQ